MITDQLLAAAAAELNDSLLAALPDPVPRHQFSVKFERKINRLIHKARHPVLCKVAKSAACFTLVLILSLIMLITVSPTARAKIVSWIKEKYSFFLEYRISEPDALETKEFELGYLPDGYIEKFRTNTVNMNTIIYEKDLDEEIHFYYLPSSKADSLFIRYVDTTPIEISICGTTADFYLAGSNGETNSLIWCDEHTGYTFYIAAPLEQELLQEIAEKIIEKNN